jgi:hypothetical protein
MDQDPGVGLGRLVLFRFRSQQTDLPRCCAPQCDISKFIEEAIRWRIFHDTVEEARAAFADVSPDELQKRIDEAVEDARAKRYRERAGK